MSIDTLTLDLLDYSKASGKTLTYSQARGLAVLNCKKIKATPLTKGYWKSLNHIINVYLHHIGAKDKALGTFSLLKQGHGSYIVNQHDNVF